MEKLHEVYQHRNTVTKEIFYVGHGEWKSNPSWRRATKVKGTTRPKEWFKIVEQYGNPIVEIISDGLTKIQAKEIEETLIREYFDRGYPLVNIRIGDKWAKPEDNPFFGKTHSEEIIRKLRDSNGGKPISQYSKDGTWIRDWETLKGIRRHLGKSHSNIWRCLNGEAKTAYGFVWRYKD
jgi:hypothetical protein